MGNDAGRTNFARLLNFRGAGAALLIACLLILVALRVDANTKKPPAQPVNIDTATEDELQQVPGIGPVTAAKIVHMRRTYGRFKRVDDLLAIKGMGRKRLEKMRKYLTVAGPAPAPAERPAAPASAPPAEQKAPPGPPSLLQQDKFLPALPWFNA